MPIISGVEGMNKEIKQSHTFRRKCPIGEMIFVMSRLVQEWSEVDDKLLVSPRLALLEGEKNSLKLKTDAYQWFKKNHNKPERILKVGLAGKYTVSESSEFLLGQVTSLWAVTSSEGLKTGKSLKQRAKERMNEREKPTGDDFDLYMKGRTGCWILEERDGDFYCDCPRGMKVCSPILCSFTI